MKAGHSHFPWPRLRGRVLVCSLCIPLFACAEVEVGIELAKRASRTLDGGLTTAEALPQQAQQQAAVSPYLEPAPDIFEATGVAQWDGKRTLQGVWVAHPLAQTARRVRVFNMDNGNAVDGALFKRDAALGGASVLVSSEAAQRLGIEPGGSAQLRIVAVTPIQNNAPTQPAAGDTATASAEGEAPAAEQQETSEAEASPVTGQASAAPDATSPASEEAADAASETAVVTTDPSTPTEEAQPATEEGADLETASASADSQDEPSSTRGDFKWERAPDAEETALQSIVRQPTPAPGKRAGVEAQPAPTAAEQAEAEPQSTTMPPEQTEAEPEPTPEPTKQAAVEPQPTSSPAKVTEPEQQPASSGLTLAFVQAGVFGVSENAAKLVEKLTAAGIPAAGKPVRSGERQLTRVVAGPFETRAERDAAQEAIRKMGLSDAIPVRR